MSERLMVFAGALLITGAACAAEATWTGKGGVVDWNATTWSTGTPPGATDTVKFQPSVHSPDFTVTPPANFTGKIVLSSYSSAATTLGDNEIPQDDKAGMLFESPATMNDTWGYKAHDQNWKSAERIRGIREHLRSIGANYLLNVGPDHLGRIPVPSVDILKSARGSAS